MLKIHLTLKKYFYTFVLLFALSSSAFSQTGTFIAISDIHFDPFHNGVSVDTLVNSPYQNWDKIFHDLGNNEFNAYWYDSDYKLFTSLLKEVSAKSTKPDFIIYTGDFIVHHFLDTLYSLTNNYSSYASNSFIHKTFGFITSKINRYYPHIPIFFTLGNNDSYTGDYNSVWDGAFLHQTSGVLFDNFIKNPELKKAFLKTYPINGCYSIRFPNTKDQRLISINTNFLSPKSNENAHGKNVLDWLETELKSARSKNENVWLILHILPGIDVFDTMAPINPGDSLYSALLFMTDNYNGRLVNMIKNYGDVISVCFGGHIHMDDFRLFKENPAVKEPASVFLHVTPSVSPIFGNNPAFQIFTYDKTTFELLDYNSFYLDLAAVKKQWAHEYSFNKAYNQNGINTKSLNIVFNKILTDPTTQSNYINFYPGKSSEASIESKWVGNWSGISNLTDSNYIRMYNKYSDNNEQK
ncbi:MAG: metallophosphoesterase [Ignavibacteria bacterium]|jgi:hypothetical protein